VLATVVDQLTKQWALAEFADGHVVELFPTLQLRLALNPGVAFGMGAELGPALVIGLIVVLLGLISWIALRILHGKDTVGTLALAAAAGGGVGNLIDRVFRAEDGPLSGHVVDFVGVEWFAIFNVADIFTTCGIALWAATTFFSSRHRKVDEPTVADPAGRIGTPPELASCAREFERESEGEQGLCQRG
jgi:signal peptidase II